MSGIYILCLRELRRYLRNRLQIFASAGQASLYLLALGYGLGAVFEKAGKGSYIQFVSPGVIAMTVLFSATFSGVALMWDRQFGVLKETLVAPIPRISVMLGRTLGSAGSSMLQGALVTTLCVMAGFRPESVGGVPLTIVFVALIAIVFAALGTMVGAMIKEAQSFQAVMSFIIMPIFFFSGALYPLDLAPSAIKLATRLDPLAYGVDALRATLVAQPHFGYGMDVTVLAPLAALFIAIGAWRFSNLQV